jgi:hypothetical protein
MPQVVNRFMLALGASALVVATLTVGVQTSSYPDSISSGRPAGIALTRDPHSTRTASESFAPPAKAAPPCGFAATGSC